jgi:hypothetical protein
MLDPSAQFPGGEGLPDHREKAAELIKVELDKRKTINPFHYYICA